MNVITPAQSEWIGAEIYLQACRLDAAADRLADPWGRLHRERLQRMARERFTTISVPVAKPVPEEGGPCPFEGCVGKLNTVREGDCSCHISPPCWACTEAILRCEACSAEVRQ